MPGIDACITPGPIGGLQHRHQLWHETLGNIPANTMVEPHKAIREGHGMEGLLRVAVLVVVYVRARKHNDYWRFRVVVTEAKNGLMAPPGVQGNVQVAGLVVVFGHNENPVSGLLKQPAPSVRRGPITSPGAR
jgi:hypothetical protein